MSPTVGFSLPRDGGRGGDEPPLLCRTSLPVHRLPWQDCVCLYTKQLRSIFLYLSNSLISNTRRPKIYWSKLTNSKGQNYILQYFIIYVRTGYLLYPKYVYPITQGEGNKRKNWDKGRYKMKNTKKNILFSQMPLLNIRTGENGLDIFIYNLR